MRSLALAGAVLALGAGAAWTYSVVVTFLPLALPEASRVVYFEAAAVITVLVLLGHVLELRAREKTSGAIRALLQAAWEGARPG